MRQIFFFLCTHWLYDKVRIYYGDFLVIIGRIKNVIRVDIYMDFINYTVSKVGVDFIFFIENQGFYLMSEIIYNEIFLVNLDEKVNKDKKKQGKQ